MTDKLNAADVVAHNKRAWDKLARAENQWTVPVDAATIARARKGQLSLLLTPSTPVPAEWLGDVRGKRVLGLACGGGQQGPCLAAAGADVTIFDNSPEQLARDRAVADREGAFAHMRRRRHARPFGVRERDVRSRVSSVFELLRAGDPARVA